MAKGTKVELVGYAMLCKTLKDHEEGAPGDARVMTVMGAGPQCVYEIGDVLAIQGTGNAVPGIGEVFGAGNVIARLSEAE